MMDRLGVIGVGLIGGSFALAQRRAGRVREIVGFDRDASVLECALSLGLIDTASSDPAGAIGSCDLVLLSAPVAQTGPILSSIAPWLSASTVLTDAGSTKQDVVGAAREALGEKIGQFVPGHPLAGREQHGPAAAQADLFQEKKVVLCPLPENGVKAVQAVRSAWEAAGASVLLLEPARHDAALAAVSHLPHLLAYALVDHVAGAVDGSEKMALAGGGFRDFTRIAASSPEMWRDIALANCEPLLAELDAYVEHLGTLRTALARRDGAVLMAFFERASRERILWGTKP